MTADRDERVEYARELWRDFNFVDDLERQGALSKAEAPARTAELVRATVSPDSNDFDVMVGMAASTLRDGAKVLERAVGLPAEIALFAADVLEGKRKRPTKRGRDTYANWPRDYKLYRLVQDVAKAFDLPHYSNNELFERPTAAGIVSLATGHSVDVVKTAYKKFRRIRG